MFCVYVKVEVPSKSTIVIITYACHEVVDEIFVSLAKAFTASESRGRGESWLRFLGPSNFSRGHFQVFNFFLSQV